MNDDSPNPRARVAAGAFVLALLAAACGGDDAPTNERAADAGDLETTHADGGKSTNGGARDAGIVGLDSGVGTTTHDDAATGNTGATSDAAVGISGIEPAELESLRQVCVDTINMYRATLSLAPLARATAAQEVCSDRGAQKDGTAKVAHGSAGNGNPCVTPEKKGFPGFGAQDTCPGWPVGRRGSATIADALKKCLMSMWNEGVPPEGTDQCVADYRAGNTACFEAHGHYINMSNAKSKVVSCGFFDMGMSTYWMNQDFQ